MKCVQSRIAGSSLVVGAALLFFTVPSALADGWFHHTEQPVAPGVVTGTCLTTADGYSASTVLQVTNSKTFTDVSGTTVSFKEGVAGCVEVSFSSEAATMPQEVLHTQVVLDNKTLCTPNDNLFASDSPSSDLADHAMNYICTGVTAGNHSVKVQFKSHFGSKVALDYRTTIVRYAP